MFEYGIGGAFKKIPPAGYYENGKNLRRKDNGDITECCMNMVPC